MERKKKIQFSKFKGTNGMERSLREFLKNSSFITFSSLFFNPSTMGRNQIYVNEVLFETPNNTFFLYRNYHFINVYIFFLLKK